jgi:hypothetical protein
MPLSCKSLRWWNWAAVLAGALGVLFAGSLAVDLKTDQVKARYIYNFIKYITWPKTGNTSKTLPIGIVNSEEARKELLSITKGKTAYEKNIEVLASSEKGPFQGLMIVYLNENSREWTSEILAQVPKGTLTIGEAPTFLARGGMIEFKLVDGKVRFGVNLAAMRAAGFEVDSKLLAVAEEVQGK